MESRINRRGLMGGVFGGAFALGLGLPAAARSVAAAPPSPADVTRYANELLERTYPANGPGAAVLVARGDQVLFRGARGLAKVETSAALTPGHVFEIGSVTKQFAAAGLMKLVEAGKVGLDDPLTKYVPGYPNGDAITVRQILNHTSGVTNYTAIPGYMENHIRADLTTAEMIAVFKDLPPDFPPGAAWNYSNSGYVLVGAVIEAASGESWHAWLDRSLFKPLGLRHTGYGGDLRFAALQADGYTIEDGKVGPARVLSMTQPHAAGALVSTVDDLLRWNRALHEGRVLGPDAYREMTTPTGKAVERGYGFGIGIGKARSNPALRHNGGIFGFSSSLCYLPGPDITVVVLENDDSDPVGDADTADTVVQRLAAVALGDPYPAMVAVPVDVATLKAAEGVYRFDGNIVRMLRVVDGRLTAQRSGPRVVLTPIGTDDFLYADGFNRIQLVRDAAGTITGVRYFASGDGDGVIGVRTNDPLPAEVAGLTLPRAALDRLLGDYAGGGLTMRVFLEGETLKAQLPGQSPVNLRAASPTRFNVVEVEAVLEFAAGDGPAADATIRQGGRDIVLKRKH